MKRSGRVGHERGKNPGDVWAAATASYRGAHFATFPQALIDKPIRATCPKRRCRGCRRPTAHRLGKLATRATECRCGTGTEPGVVLDPFFGAGTVGVVAQRHGRHWIGIELNPAFADLANQRIANEPHPTATTPTINSKGGEDA